MRTGIQDQADSLSVSACVSVPGCDFVSVSACVSVPGC